MAKNTLIDLKTNKKIKFTDNFKRYEIILEEYTDNFNINAIALDNGVFIYKS